MAFGLVMEALARLEHKLDLILKAVKPDANITTPMMFPGHQCPLCTVVIVYQIDLGNNVVVRRCGCSTGKFASTIPLSPVEQKGTTSAPATRSPSPPAPDRD